MGAEEHNPPSSIGPHFSHNGPFFLLDACSLNIFCVLTTFVLLLSLLPWSAQTKRSISASWLKVGRLIFLNALSHSNPSSFISSLRGATFPFQ